MEGRIHSTETFGAVDGPGIRYVVFLQGCPLKCLYCHNPDSWDAKKGKIVTAQALCNDIARYKNFISTGGVTLSGGEPLMQPDFAFEIIQICKKMNIHTAIDTAGSIFLSDKIKGTLQATDLLLLDVKAADADLYHKLTGGSLKNTIEMLDFAEEIGKKVWIRHVLVPGYTMKKELIVSLATCLNGYKCIEKVELIPFHKMGEFKWQALNLKYELANVPVPTKKEIEECEQIFAENYKKSLKTY